MRTLKIFYFLGFIILLILFVWQLSEAGVAYPPGIQQRIEGAQKIICEKETPRRVGTIAYVKDGGLVRIFTKDGEEMEIWLDKSISPLSLYFGFRDKKYYYENGEWLDQDVLLEEESQRLANRLKFSFREMQFFKECFEEKMRAAS